MRLLLIITVVMCSGCTASGSVSIGGSDSYSRRELEQAFKERDAYLGFLNDRLLKLEKPQ